MIPEKWKIRRNHENCEMLNKWNNEHPLFKEQGRDHANFISHSCDKNGDFFYPDRQHLSQNHNKSPSGYTEITKEQFIEFVLNKQKEPVYDIY